MRKIIFTLILLFAMSMTYAQGVTTSSMKGQVSDQNSEPLIGANITAIHAPTGTFYGVSSDEEGYYRIANTRVGGPYTVTISFVGYEDVVLDNIYLRLGESFSADVTMGESAFSLGEVFVTATAGTVGQSSGASTQINAEQIQNIPTLNRDIDDFLKLTPQASSFGGGTSFAGVNNRYNAIFVDGAVNNDVFGLASSGTNGGQTGISPFSIDIIEQFQVVLSPYDVALGGFAGGGVNAVTKSGTNDFAGTAYYFFQNENLVGKTNGTLAERLGIADGDRTRVAEFNKKTFGASLGGPLVKDKVFFFTNVELQDDVIPVPFETAQYTSVANRASESDLNNLRSFLMNTYGYDPGTFGDTQDALEGLKVFGKLDFNLSNSNKLTLRHQYTKAEQFNRNGGRSNRINFSNNGVFFPSTTNSSALELNSRINDKVSNNLIIGYTSVKDDRGSLGANFPFVVIDDGNNGSIRFGTEEFSTGNVLEQKIFTITNNLKLYRGKHTFTLGTHNEFYNIRNVFIRQNFGSYDFGTLDEFLSGAPADDYDRSYSLIAGDENVIGDDSQAAAEFKAMQLGFYAQDEIEVNNKLRITAGLRIDIPIITSDPAIHSTFESGTLPGLQAQYDIANDITPGQAPDGQIMISPRVGFEFLPSGTISTVVRGGIGIFTSRVPFVWPGGMFTNNGLTIGSVDERDIAGDVLFRPDPANQYSDPAFSTPSGQLDLFASDFKYPQVLRGNLALDKALSGGWKITLEGIYTKTLNNVLYQNVNSDTEVAFNWTGSPDNRPVYTRSRIDGTYGRGIYVGYNTNKGYTYNLTASAAKSFDFGLDATFSYTYGDAEAINEGTSSQNSSQWRGQIHVNGRNNPLLGRSDYSSGSRIIAALNYKLKWNNSGSTATTFSLFYGGQSGRAFSYVYTRGAGDSRNINQEDGSTSRNRSLIFVPGSASEINLIDYTSNGTLVTAAQQWTNLDALIEDDSNLSSQRGQYSKKNGSREPFQSNLDFAIRQDLGINAGGKEHKFQISLDFFNFANFLNKDWGARYSVIGDFNNNELIQFEGYAADGTTPQFTYRDDKLGKDRLDISSGSSRWRARVGLRYIFGSSGISAGSSSAKIDSDGDGIKDSKDDCPDIAGIRKHNGCPMSAEDMAAKAQAKAQAEADAAAAAAKIAAEQEAAIKAEADAKAAEAARIAAAEKEAAMKAEAEDKVAAEAEAAEVEAARAAASKARDAEIRRTFSAALQGIQFNSARSTFKSESYSILDEAVSTLSRYSDVRVLIQGHTDSQGDAVKNKTLSHARADAVKEYLVSKGISASRLSINGLGEATPVADNNTSEGRAQNRRVEFVVIR